MLLTFLSFQPMAIEVSAAIPGDAVARNMKITNFS